MTPVPLEDALDPARFGPKAASLGRALRAGLPVPPGCALAVTLVEALAKELRPDLLRSAVDAIGFPLTVRSSAVGEDSGTTSFAGIHSTILNVRAVNDALAAVREVHGSCRTDAAIEYRRRLGIPGPPAMGVILQRMVVPECAGVLFTRDPITGADQRLVEAAWGLGETVVAGLVVPDTYRLDRDGRVLECVPGEKDVMILPSPVGRTHSIPVEPGRVSALCLDDARLARLNELAARCEEAYGRGGLDIEWALADERLYLLQCRAITRGA